MQGWKTIAVEAITATFVVVLITDWVTVDKSSLLKPLMLDKTLMLADRSYRAIFPIRLPLR